MPRKRFQREPCDCKDCLEAMSIENTSVPGSTQAAALQQPPPKSLIVFGDGALLPRPSSDRSALDRLDELPSTLCTSLDDAVHHHLDGLARDGCSGLLAVQSSTDEGLRSFFVS